MAIEGRVSTTIGALLKRDGGSVKTGPFGTTLKAKEYSKDGVPLISVGEVGYGSLRVHETTPRAPREVVERLPEYLLEAGDIVFGRKGAVDRSAMVKPEQAGWFLGSDGIRLRLPNTCDTRFIAYQLQSSGTRSWLLQHATGTTMASLNQGTIERVPIALPPLPEQRAIAHILGTLDDKIELNRRMNETLEAIARALFKSWFVDFDPVRAKSEGRDPGLPPHLADLFPDSFEGSELGQIPQGWGVDSAYRIAHVLYGAPFKSNLFNDRRVGHPLIRIRDLRTHDPKVFTSEEHPRGYVAQPGDLVVGMDGEFRAHLWRGPEAWLNQRLCCFKPAAAIPRAFVHYSIESLLDLFERSKTGTTVIHLSKADIDTFRVLFPPDPVLRAFASIVDPIDLRMVAAAQEGRTLTSLRDHLLPRLISGDIAIRGVEDLAEATA